MKLRSVVLLACIVLGAFFAYAQNLDPGYQPAQVVTFEKVPADEQHPENTDHYRVSMRLAGLVYLCSTSGPISTFMGWAPGKEFPAKILDKNTMLVQSPNGQTVQLNIKKIRK